MKNFVNAKNGNVIRLYRELYNDYHNSVSWKDNFKAIFMQKNGWCFFTVSLVLLFIVMSSCFIYGACHEENNSILFFSIFPVVLILFFVAMKTRHHGVPLLLKDNEIVKELWTLPWSMRDQIICYAYFCQTMTTREVIPSIKELDSCLAFIESLREGKPSNFRAYFRHPVVLAILGIIVVLINNVAAQLLKNGDPLKPVLAIVALVAFVLYIGALIYRSLYMGVRSHWNFECCLRWYKLARIQSKWKANEISS